MGQVPSPDSFAMPSAMAMCIHRHVGPSVRVPSGQRRSPPLPPVSIAWIQWTARLPRVIRRGPYLLRAITFAWRVRWRASTQIVAALDRLVPLQLDGSVLVQTTIGAARPLAAPREVPADAAPSNEMCGIV